MAHSLQMPPCPQPSIIILEGLLQQKTHILSDSLDALSTGVCLFLSYVEISILSEFWVSVLGSGLEK